MIAQYEDDAVPAAYASPRQYGLSQSHKHLPEMKQICALTNAPAFLPIVDDYYSGMEVSVPVFSRQLRGSAEDVREAYRQSYSGPVVRYREGADEDGFLAANALSGRDDMEISVYGNEERLLLTARFDNLGKGASGAAIQNMNLLMGVTETTGLSLKED